jgi:hypothetical protein
MGYHSPNAEEVYRYIFRLDRDSRPSLSDGFSWSILFVNDSSSICKEFLAEYGAELCHRTADRVRFVFFSGLSEGEFQGVASAANRRGGGFLARVLQATISLSSRPRIFDYERDDWNMLRPEAFHPLNSQKRISQQISMECEMHSAMPGSQEALRLAQTLGIGRFVPCFLLFSDIGTPSVFLFPIAGRTSQQAFERIRTWVDSFYEVNRSVLTRWASIENSIEKAVRKYQTSISNVAYWRNERQAQWTALQKVSGYLNLLANSQPSAALLDTLNEDSSIPWKIRGLISPFLDQLKAIDQKQRYAQEVKVWLDRVRAITDSQLLYTELWNFKHQRATGLPESVRACLAVVINQLTPVKQPPSSESELADWWRSEFGRPSSRKQYDKYRTAWSHYSIAKHGEAAKGNVARILKDEFTIVQQAVLKQAVGCPPEEAAQEVVDRLAAHLDVNPKDNLWEESVSGYQRALIEYFRNLGTHAPPWMVQTGATSSPSLCWEDCIPTVEQRKKAGHKKALDELPRLRELVEQTRMNWDSRLREIEAEHRERQNRGLNELVTAIDSWLSSINLLAADRQSVWLALITSLSRSRQDLEELTFKNANDAAKAPYPGDVFSPDESSELLRLLDEYDQAAASINFPFEGDREVLRVTLDTPLINASGIMVNRPTSAVSKSVKDELRSAVENAERSLREWEGLKQEATVWSPSGKFISALTRTLNTSRMAELLSFLGVESPNAAVGVLTTQDQAISLLDALSVHELIALEQHVVEQNPRNEKPRAGTKQELHDSILVAVGLLPRHDKLIGPDSGQIETSKLDTLRNKVKSGIFDVFLAHNSQDKAAVLRLSQELRRQGIHPWVDVEQIPPGHWFQDVIQSAVRTVRTAAVIIGGSGVGRWQALELRVFMSRCVEQGIPLIPVLLPGVATIPDGLEFLRELNHVKFGKDVTEEEGLSRLVWGITGKKQ